MPAATWGWNAFMSERLIAKSPGMRAHARRSASNTASGESGFPLSSRSSVESRWPRRARIPSSSSWSTRFLVLRARSLTTSSSSIALSSTSLSSSSFSSWVFAFDSRRVATRFSKISMKWRSNEEAMSPRCFLTWFIASNSSCCSAREVLASAAAKRSFSTFSSASAMMPLSLERARSRHWLSKALLSAPATVRLTAAWAAGRLGVSMFYPCGSARVRRPCGNGGPAQRCAGLHVCDPKNERLRPEAPAEDATRWPGAACVVLVAAANMPDAYAVVIKRA